MCILALRHPPLASRFSGTWGLKKKKNLNITKIPTYVMLLPIHAMSQQFWNVNLACIMCHREKES